MTESALGCAQNFDGSLRDAADIVFYQDRDDEHPISAPAASSSTRKIHGFFTGATKPVGKVAGSRRSARTSQPSGRLTDPNNAESSVSAGKRKAAPTAATSRQPKVARRSAATPSDSEPDSEGEDPAENSDAAEDTEGDDGVGQEVMDLEEYHAIKTMADADHAQAVAKVAGADSTADIRTVFTRVKDHKNPTTGVVESGSICKICVAKGHYAIYKARCEKLGIEENERAIPKAKGVSGQGNLDGVVVTTPRPPPFTPEGLLDFLTELIVTQDELYISHAVPRGTVKVPPLPPSAAL
ncbi:hypothetical protein B0H16DRAFT_1453332 [Mycena metata]|uniref:Uncharacterized protein n=1 Tax=Mycena metata TaxID=1033252 RepID=A0AAD7JLY1_9AGAR|nr:hypothetical protein B0H16DRAFT_1453332 [Mycena metata]